MLSYIGNTEIIQLLLRNYKVRDSQACIEYNKTSGVWIGEWHWNNRVQKVDTELACDPMNRNSTPLSVPSTKPSIMYLNMCPSSSQRESPFYVQFSKKIIVQLYRYVPTTLYVCNFHYIKANNNNNNIDNKSNNEWAEFLRRRGCGRRS